MTNPVTLVTGGAGFIGSHVVAGLLANGHSVRVLDNLSTGRKEAVPEPAELVVGDILDESTLNSVLVGVDRVIHLAGHVSIRASIDRLQHDFDVNLRGTLSLLQAIGQHPVRRLVHASSMAVYAGAKGAAPISEDHPTVPLSPYGTAKLASEHYCRLFCERAGIEWVSLRYFNTYGQGQRYTPYVGVITIFINELRAGRAPTIFGDGNQTRDFVHVTDVATATITACTPGAATGLFNLGSGRGISINDLLATVQQHLGTEQIAVYKPARPEEPLHTVADINRARSLLGYSLRYRLLDLHSVL